jgi:hypothetical protein
MIAAHVEFHKDIAPIAAFPAQLISNGYGSLEIRIFRAFALVKCLLAVHASYTLTKLT